MFKSKEFVEDIKNGTRQFKAAVLTMSLGLVGMAAGAGLEIADNVEINGHHIIETGLSKIGALTIGGALVLLGGQQLLIRDARNDENRNSQIRE